MKNEKNLTEMLKDNFVEISKEGQQSINGGKRFVTLVYAVSPKTPKNKPNYGVC